MKHLLFVLFAWLTGASYAQVLNGGFENGIGGDLSSWEWTCAAQPFNNAPPGGGNWCIQVFGGNLQGCFPGYAYQKIPSITNGQSFVLSGWAYAQTSPPVGIFFGKTNNGAITIQAGDTTSSASWTQLSVQSGFTLSAGDTAVVVLYGGIATGPVQGYGYFDLINLQLVTGINPIEQNQFMHIFPSPFSTEATFETSKEFKDATLTVTNAAGQTVKEIRHLSGKSLTLRRDHLPVGLYLIRLLQEGKLIAAEKILIADK